MKKHAPRNITGSKYNITATSIIPAASVNAVNSFLDSQGLGPCATIPVTLDTQPEMAKDSEPLITHYAISMPLTSELDVMIKNIVESNGGTHVRKRLNNALSDKSAKLGHDAHPYLVMIVIRAANRAAIITRLEAKFPNAGTRFFTTQLSATGSAPVQAYFDSWHAGAAFLDSLKWLADNVPKCEIIIAERKEGIRLGPVKAIFSDPMYRDNNAANRTRARVWIRRDWTRQDVLDQFNLKIIN